MNSAFVDHCITYSQNDLTTDSLSASHNNNVQASSPFYKTIQSLLNCDKNLPEDDILMAGLSFTRKHSQIEAYGVVQSQTPSLVNTLESPLDDDYFNLALDQTTRIADTNSLFEEIEHFEEASSICDQSRAIKKLSSARHTTLMARDCEDSQTKQKRAKKGFADPQERARKNRISAQKSREKKENRLQELEVLCSNMAEENRKLATEKAGMALAFRNLMAAYNVLSQNIQTLQNSNETV